MVYLDTAPVRDVKYWRQPGGPEIELKFKLLKCFFLHIKTCLHFCPFKAGEYSHLPWCLHKRTAWLKLRYSILNKNSLSSGMFIFISKMFAFTFFLYLWYSTPCLFRHHWGQTSTNCTCRWHPQTLKMEAKDPYRYVPNILKNCRLSPHCAALSWSHRWLESPPLPGWWQRICQLNSHRLNLLAYLLLHRSPPRSPEPAQQLRMSMK